MRFITTASLIFSHPWQEIKEGKPVGINQHIGRLDKALVEAEAHGWTVVNIKNEWKVIFP
ncbi:MAG: hypothetical protein U9P36_11450 [Thermodesulfobacteriota bacterium]|nr:hypothetical protein [Thermodesulfobacteriota bacterium]